METWTPPVLPSPPLPKTVTPKVLQAEFGDGYASSMPDGLNHMLLDPFELRFNSISSENAETMNTFMRARGGTERFYYTLPLESTPRIFRGAPFGVEISTTDGTHSFKVTLKEQPS